MPTLFSPELSIAIVGPGALGSLMAAMLSKRGFHNLRFWHRSGVIQHRFEMRGLSAQIEQFDFPSPSSSSSGESVDIMILAVKCYDVEAALRKHLADPVMRNLRSILVVSNGMLDELAPDLVSRSSASILLATTTFGVKALSAGQFAAVNQSGWLATGADSCLGQKRHQLRDLQSLFAAMQPDGWVWSQHSKQLRQIKWLMNTSLNSICGLYKLDRNQEALAHRDELRDLFEEAFRLGCRLWGNYPESSEQLWQRLLELIAATADNENSMAQDIRLGRRHESEFLSGLCDLDADHDYPHLKRVSKALQKVL